MLHAVDGELARQLAASGYYAPGLAGRYDAARPRPPETLRELLPALAGVARPKLVVDLGSGTGLSTRFWAEAADEVIGVEPNGAICAWAEANTEFVNVRYVCAPAEDTGLPEASADIVTAAQSFHWFDPDRALAEVGRLLRPGGVFCAYNYAALQTSLWKPEAAWAAVREQVGPLRAELGLGSLQTRLAAGVDEAAVGLDELRRQAAAMPAAVRWWISYRAWLGLRAGVRTARTGQHEQAVGAAGRPAPPPTAYDLARSVTAS